MWTAAASLVLLLLQTAAAPSAADRGIKALDAQRYDEALTAFQEAVQAEPKNHFNHFSLAFALSMLRRDDEAVGAYRKALELEPNLPQAKLNLGLLLLRLKKPAEAFPYLEEIAAANPQDLNYQLPLGEALLAAREFLKAEAQFRRILTLQPKSASAELGLGQALASQGKLDEAQEHYHRAVELDPKLSEALLELASLYEANKRFKEASRLYLNFPANPIARERAGELLLDLGDAKSAIPHLEAAVSSSPTSVNRAALVRAYLMENDAARAESLLTDALKSEPQNATLRMIYARLLRDRKDYGGAAKQFYQAALAQPNSPEPWSDLASVLILAEQDVQALQALDKVTALGAEKPAHSFFRAIVLDRQKQPKAALAAYEKFLATSGGKFPDEEFKARQRVRIIKNELSK